MFGKQENIFRPVSQRRQIERHNTQPIIEVFSKTFLTDRFSEIGICCGDDAHVDRDRVGSADASDNFLFQNAE